MSFVALSVYCPHRGACKQLQFVQRTRWLCGLREAFHRSNRSDSVCRSNISWLFVQTNILLLPQDLEEVEDRLMTLSERVTLCNRVLNDLKDLSDVLVVSSLYSPLEPCEFPEFENNLVFYRENLSRMCPCHRRSDQKWKSLVSTLFLI